MFILEVPASPQRSSFKFALPHDDLEVDSDVIVWEHLGHYRNNYTFTCTVEGKTLTVKRTDCNFGWCWPIHFRAYNPAVEDVPTFASECSDTSEYTYMYQGHRFEKAPAHARIVKIHPSVKIIRKEAFRNCHSMKTCIMGNNVTKIEEFAFWHCRSLERIQLSRKLVSIGKFAFSECTNIPFMYVPPSIQNIGQGAFDSCANMRVLVLPPTIRLDQIGERIVEDCPALFYNNTLKAMDDRAMIDWIIHRYDNSPLLKLCTDPDVTAGMIHDYVKEHGTDTNGERDRGQQLTPLHMVSSINTHAGYDAVVACFHVDPTSLFERDAHSDTPLDYLWKNNQIDLISQLMSELCIQIN